jgi:uncharacterized membrane protein
MKRTKWWLYTVLIGLLPFFVRSVLATIASKSPPWYFLNEVDIVTFGLVLIISTISEIDEQPLINRHLAMSVKVILVIVLILLSILLGISYLMELGNLNSFDKRNLQVFALLLALTAFIFSIAVFYNKDFDNGTA